MSGGALRIATPAATASWWRHEHDRVELPREVHQVSSGAVQAALHAGKAVTIAPQSMTLTTQQAADLLGVSRPTVVRLIKSAELAAERITATGSCLTTCWPTGRPAAAPVRRRLPRAQLTSTPTSDLEVIYEQLREA